MPQNWQWSQLSGKVQRRPRGRREQPTPCLKDTIVSSILTGLHRKFFWSSEENYGRASELRTSRAWATHFKIHIRHNTIINQSQSIKPSIKISFHDFMNWSGNAANNSQLATCFFVVVVCVCVCVCLCVFVCVCVCVVAERVLEINAMWSSA